VHSGPPPGGGGRQVPGRLPASVIDGMDIGPPPPVTSAGVDDGRRYPVPGKSGLLQFTDKTLTTHVLFLGSIGSGKTNALMHLVREIRERTRQDDVIVVFDTKGDFRREFGRPGDAVISGDPGADPYGVVWNIFLDLLGDDASARSEQIYEIAATIFGQAQEQAGENAFFSMAACDIFAAVVEIMTREGGQHSNAELRERLELSSDDLLTLMRKYPDLGGTARYLEGERTPESVLAFLQQTLNRSFSGAFRLPGGTFSVRDFVRGKSGRALFIEYDIAVGSRLLPVYRVLLDMAIKEALSLGRRDPGRTGSVFFVLDEFALLPHLEHISDGINFGRDLGLKFLAATQNVNQVRHAYGAAVADSILSGFGTVFAFRLMDDASRRLVQERFGGNRKQVSAYAAVRSAGIHQDVVDGHVIEDWHLSALVTGHCLVALPAGPPFFFATPEYQKRRSRVVPG
jgi:type IV secretory pathway TraG/TraD family ATPase VirD4